MKVAKETHTALYLLAGQRNMTIGDAAALLLGVSLMERYHLDEDAAAREQRITHEKQIKERGEMLAQIERAERQKREDV